MRFMTGPPLVVEEGVVIELRGLVNLVVDCGGAAVCGGGDWIFVGW